MKISVIRKRYGGATLDAKVLRRFMKESLEAAALFWYTELLPKHFKRGASTAYKYKRRTWATYRRKKAQGLPPVALVTKRGTLQKLSTRQATISGSANRARVSFSVPPHTSAQYRDEMTRVNGKDSKLMIRRLRLEMQERIDGYNAVKTEVLT